MKINVFPYKLNYSLKLQIKCIHEKPRYQPYLTCDFKCVWLGRLYVDLPGSCLLVSVETNSPQVAYFLYGPQFTAGLVVALGHTWNFVAYINMYHNDILSKKREHLHHLKMQSEKHCIGNGVLPAGLVRVKVMDVPVM